MQERRTSNKQERAECGEHHFDGIAKKYTPVIPAMPPMPAAANKRAGMPRLLNFSSRT
jgi:hypothetical protein